jgi:hypothetical protein
MFSSQEEYANYWLYLIQYEIFSRLLSRSSNKKQKIEVNEDIERLELLTAAEKQNKEK